MGQRLNVEIHGDGKCLANCYYHWSGYTSCAIELTKMVLGAIDGIGEAKVDVPYAVKLLKATGAGLIRSEVYDALGMGVPSSEIVVGENRNDGLISITEKGMEETRNWEEARVTIDVTNMVICFDAFWDVDEFDDYDSLFDDYDMVDMEDINIDMNEISFDDFGVLEEAYKYCSECDRHAAHLVKDKAGRRFMAIE